MEERLDIQVTVAPRKFLLNLNIINAHEHSTQAEVIGYNNNKRP